MHVDSPETSRNACYGGIPVRNLWLLMLYASQLFRHMHHSRVSAEENPDEIPDLVAEILIRLVERRLRQNLTFGYRERASNLSRVRGRIDTLHTESHQLLARGVIRCRFQDLTVDTPRNRYIRAALELLSRIAIGPETRHNCRTLVKSLRNLGVIGERPSNAEISADRYGRHDKEDQVMVSAAKLAFNLLLPNEVEGNRAMPRLSRDLAWIRHLYEKAVAGFYDVVLGPNGWNVYAGRYIHWPLSDPTPGLERIFPSMQTDIILENSTRKRRIVIDTKFNNILSRGQYDQERLRSAYIYQIYAYLRSQENPDDPFSENSSGLLLHPAVEESINESAAIQGHIIRFATVDLSAPASSIRDSLIRIVNEF